MGYLILLLIAFGGVWLAISALKDMTSPKQLQEEEHSRPIHDSKEILELKRRMQKMAEEQGFVITGWGDVFEEEDGKLGIECYTHVPDGKEGEYVETVKQQFKDNLKDMTIIPCEDDEDTSNNSKEKNDDYNITQEEIIDLLEDEKSNIHIHFDNVENLTIAGKTKVKGDIIEKGAVKIGN